MYKSFKKSLLPLILIISIGFQSIAQQRHRKGPNQVTYPEVSKQASISQTIGITTIEINYHRPKTLGRNLWGALIPYGKVWRAGANESTTISFTDDVIINGNPLAAGIYSIHMIPEQENWTVIFSNNHTQWGSFYYDQKEDALRVSVKPEAISHKEALTYSFDTYSEDQAVLSMNWEKVRISLEVKIDLHQTVIAEFRRNLQTLPRFRWFGNREAALYCVLNETHLEEALTWVDRSLRFQENFDNMIVKADLLRLMNRKTEADQWESKAVAIADTIDWIAYGYESMSHHGRINKAIEIFKRGIKYYPDSYILHRGLGEAYGRQQDKAMAQKAFLRAKALARTKDEKEQLTAYMARYYLKP